MFGSCQSLARNSGSAANLARLPPDLDVNSVGLAPLLATGPTGVHAEMYLEFARLAANLANSRSLR